MTNSEFIGTFKSFEIQKIVETGGVLLKFMKVLFKKNIEVNLFRNVSEMLFISRLKKGQVCAGDSIFS